MLTNGFTSAKYNETGGWVGFNASSNGVLPALGLVFGSDHATPLPNQRSTYSLFRPGYAGGAFKPGETDWRNYLVIECIRLYNLYEGSGFWSRYYFVLGDDLPDLSARIANRNLVDSELRAMEYTESETPLVAYSFSGTGPSFRVTENSRAPQFFLYAYPENGSVPIFEIIEDDESRYLTWNPYANSIVEPHDGTIAGMRLLGFARQTADVSGSSYAYESLDVVMAGAPENYMADGKLLSVRTATSLETWRVEHFGFTDDSGDGANLANPDGDVANNLYEYGFGGNPTNPADIGYLPTSGTSAKGGTNVFEYGYARRIDSAGELTYTVEHSDNLVSNDWNAANYTELPMTGTLDPDFEVVTNRIDTVGKTNEFIRLKIDAF